MDVEQIEKIIETDYNLLLERLKSNLISIFVIGSMQEPKTKLKRYNDYDLRIVVKNMDESTYKTIVDFNENIKQKIKLNLNIDVDYSFIIGPVRHITKSKINLLIHCIPMTLETLENLPLTHKYSYSCNYRIIFGKDILEKYKSIRYTGKDIIECTEGINYCINMIYNNKIKYAYWKIGNDSIDVINDEQKMDDSEMFEVLRYSVSKSLYNTVQLDKWNGIKTYDNMRDNLKALDIDSEVINDIEMLSNCSFETYEENKEKLRRETINALEKIKAHIIVNKNYYADYKN